MRTRYNLNPVLDDVRRPTPLRWIIFGFLVSTLIWGSLFVSYDREHPAVEEVEGE